MYILTGILGVTAVTFLCAPIIKKILYKIAYGGLCIYSEVMNSFDALSKRVRKYIINQKSEDSLTVTTKIKDNCEVSEDNVDFLIVSTINKESLQKWNKIYKMNEDMVTMKKCSFRFISCSIKFRENNFIICLNDALETYFIVGNVLNKQVLMYLLKKQHGHCESEFKTCIIDHNVKLFTLGENQSILLMESDYLLI